MYFSVSAHIKWFAELFIIQEIFRILKNVIANVLDLQNQQHVIETLPEIGNILFENIGKLNK